MLGIVLIHKPTGCTSHDIVNAIRRKIGERRVGHAGTLDPMATGLLVVAVGPATRFLQYLPLEPKEYIARIRFGMSTSTYDAEGAMTAERPVPEDLGAAIQSALPPFMGLIQQQPPMFSAVKVDGQPLYKLARQGKEIERAWRTVHIGKFEIEVLSENEANARIVCSGGTYVRSLAHDLGEAMGCGAHLTALQRTGVGRFRIEDAVLPEDLSPSRVLPLEIALQPMPMLHLDEVRTAAIRQGRDIVIEEPPESNLIALIEPSGKVFSVAKITDGLAHPECVIPEGMQDDGTP